MSTYIYHQIYCDTENDWMYLDRGDGCIVSLSETAEIIQSLCNFIKSVSQSEIDSYNQKLNDERSREYAETREHHSVRNTLLRNLEEGKSRQYKLKAFGNLEITPGYVYLARVCGYSKIGATRNLENRKRLFRKDFKNDFELVHAISTNDIFWCEYLFLKEYHSKNVRGEYFDLSPQDIEGICKHSYLEVRR
jgi:hypothetical protein